MAEKRAGSPPPPKLGCRRCGCELEIGPSFSGCRRCADEGVVSPLEVHYDYDWHRDHATIDQWRGRSPSLWSYHELLPLPDDAQRITLIEGGTPLIPLPGDGPGEIWVKDETRNPTGAFKDRFHSVSVSMAMQLGFDRVASSSTGNHGTSLAAYAARAGLRCLIFIDPRAPSIQADLIQLFGAHVVSIARRRDQLAWLVSELGWYPSTGLIPWPVATPYGIEGYKTIGHEIFFQLGGRMPQRVICPTSVGDVLYGPWRGFVELEHLGAEPPLPKMYAAQATGCDPVVQAVEKRAQTVPVHPSPDTVALSIGDETAATYTLTAIYDSEGGAIAVDDALLYESMRILGGIGIAAEPSACASVAAALELRRRGDLEAGETIICVVTGAAVKWPDTVGAAAPARMLRDENIDSIRAWITALS